MYRRGSVNINELINRFESVEDDSGITENIKYASRPGGIMHMFEDDEEYNNSRDDENRLVRYGERQKRFKRRNNVSIASAKAITKQTIATLLCRLSGFLEMVSKFPFPRMSVMSFGITSLLAVFFSPRSFTERALYPGFKIVFAIIFPAYRSFKAVRNKNLKEYLKWIIYWIVFSFFTCFELITDAMFSWFPFYFEIKMIFLIWTLGPSTKGGIKLYKTCIHPTLISHEQEIDGLVKIAEDQGYMHIFRLGSKSVNYANKIIMQESRTVENNIPHSHQIMRNISLSNLSDVDIQPDDIGEIHKNRKFSTENISPFDYQSLSFEQARRQQPFNHRCKEISSGYSSPGVDSYNSLSIVSSRAREEQDVSLRGMLENTQILKLRADQSQQHLLNKLEQFPQVMEFSSVLSDSKIVSAYGKLIERPNDTSAQDKSKDKAEITRILQSEFLKWVESKQNIQPNSDQSAVGEKVKSKIETDIPQETLSSIEEKYREPSADFDEFKDVISDKEDEEKLEYLNVPLVILEENEKKEEGGAQLLNQKGEDTLQESPLVIGNLTIVDDVQSTESDLIEAKITLSNSPLKVVTNFSSSSVSLASSDDCSVDATKQRPVKHSKGRAPAPPGQFYDTVTKKHFKETEL